MEFRNTLEFARELDAKDELRSYRDQFHFPVIDGNETVYFTGNSLGLQPKAARAALQQELDDWAKWGVEGHFHAKNPWYSYHEMFAEPVSKLVGARPAEVAVMNGLTANLHFLLASFYRPTETRYKIICEAKAFPSDQYALESQARFHGLDPDDVIIEIAPREGEHLVNHEDIYAAIEEHGDSVATLLIGGVNYYSGQVFDMQEITKRGHEKGIMVGFDLAHATGNIVMELHDWQVDFASWCSYKYLNSGPGSVAGIYVHQNHCEDKTVVRLAGWWGHDKETRFLMEKGFNPIPTAESWQVSNAPIFSMAIHKASVDLFAEVGMKKLREKSEVLTSYLEYIIQDVSDSSEGVSFEIITPTNLEERGCQLSILAHGQGKDLFNKISAKGVVADWREPNCIRIAPVPMYNSFEDCFNFGAILKESIS